MKITLTEGPTVNDALDIAFGYAIKQKQMTVDESEFLKKQELAHDVITDDNAHLTPFGQALFERLGVGYDSEITEDGFVFTLTFKN